MQISSNCTGQKQNMLQKALKNPNKLQTKQNLPPLPQPKQVKAEMRNDYHKVPVNY